LAQQQVQRVQVRPVPGGVRWSGTVAPTRIAAAWHDGGARFEIFCPSGPEELGAVVGSSPHCDACATMQAGSRPCIVARICGTAKCCFTTC
jgi:hypothetical protein